MLKLIGILPLALALANCDSSSTANDNNIVATNENENSNDNSNDNTNTNDNLSLEQGQLLFMNPHEDGNAFSCALCHAIGPSTIRTPGHPLNNSYNRQTFKNGKADSLLASVNSCRTEWMNATAYSEDDTNWLSLEVFLKDQAEGEGNESITFTITSPPEDLSGGTASSGQATFNETCALCHGQDAKGLITGPSLIGTALTKEKIAERVRLSGTAASPVYDGLTGGRMPFWSLERLSNAELLDVVAYVDSLRDQEPEEAPEEPAPADVSLPNSQANCTSTSSKVGQTLTLSELAHGVKGSAEIKDDCTIELKDFYYDGKGVDVRVYTGTGGDFSNGSIISANLLGQEFTGQKASVRLPAGMRLSDFDSISIWCVPIGISFGHGTFQ